MDSTAPANAGIPAQDASKTPSAAIDRQANADTAQKVDPTPAKLAQPALSQPAAPAAVAGVPAGAATTAAPAEPSTATRTFSGLPTRPAKATAAVQQPAHAAPASPAGSIGGTLFALALVLGLIFGLAWLARRMPGIAGMRGNTGLRIVRSLALGTRERLVVVEVGGTQLLLGTGASGTRLLHTLETPLQDDAPTPPTPFAQLLAQRLGKKPA